MATNKTTKYIFITGGVLSSLGKGLAAASIGAIMEARGLKVCNIKLDPYINVDPGTMSPFQHGEVLSPTTGPKPTWISGTTSASPRASCMQRTTSPRVRSMMR